MPESSVHTTLLYLLRAGLWGDENDNLKFSLSREQWLELYQLSNGHLIDALVFDGLQGIAEEMLPPKELLLKWTVRVDQIERQNLQMNRCISEQLVLFQKRNFDPILLKGQGVAACYRNPLHRVCGDVDWYFSINKYNEVNQFIKNLGLKIEFTAGFSAAYNWNGIVVEHHKRMFDIHNPFSFKFLRVLLQESVGQHLKLEKSLVPILEPTLMILQVNVHILKHLMSFGIGIRHLCDSARVYYNYQKDLDGKLLKKIYEKLGILPWIHLLHKVLVEYIGLPKEALPFSIPIGFHAEWMMEDIWKSGNFGFFDSSYGVIDNATKIRNNSKQRLWLNFKKYVKYAPMEAVSFPLVHTYSKYFGN